MTTHRLAPLQRSPAIVHSLATLVLAFGIGTLAASCGGDSTPLPGPGFPVDQAGPYRVGYRTLDVTYTPPGSTTPRTLPIALWYPADPAGTEALLAPENPLYLYIQSEVAIVDAPLAAPAYPGGYPVIVHSHGHFGFESQSYWNGEGLAALGFVVIAPGHIGDRIQDVNTMHDAVDDMYLRVTDIRATLDLLENLPSADPLSDKCNTDRVILTGHSRGTNTVWAAIGAPFSSAYVMSECDAGRYDMTGGCPAEKLAVYGTDLSDPRIVGGVPMAGDGAPAFFGGYAGMNTVTVPVMMMSGSLNPVGDDQVWANVTSPDMFWADFTGGCHDLFGTGTCPPADIDNAVAQPAIRTYLYAFARRHIFNDTSASVVGILAGTTTVSGIVDYTGR